MLIMNYLKCSIVNFTNFIEVLPANIQIKERNQIGYL